MRSFTDSVILILQVLAAIAVLTAGLILARKFRRRAELRRQERSDARNKAITSAESLQKLQAELKEKGEAAVAALTSVESKLDDEATAHLMGLQEAAIECKKQFDELLQKPRSDPNGNLPTAGYLEIAEQNKEAVSACQAAGASLDAIIQFCAYHQHMIDDITADYESCSRDITVVKGHYQQMLEEGYRFDSQRSIELLETRLSQARRAIEQRSYSEAAAALKNIRDLGASVVSQLTELRQRRERLVGRHQALSGTFASLHEAQQELSDRHGAVRQRYHVSCQGMIGPVPDTVWALTTAEVLLAEAADAVSMRQQAWEKSGRLLDEADELLKNSAAEQSELLAKFETLDAYPAEVRASLELLESQVGGMQSQEDAENFEPRCREIRTALEGALPAYPALHRQITKLLRETKERVQTSGKEVVLYQPTQMMGGPN